MDLKKAFKGRFKYTNYILTITTVISLIALYEPDVLYTLCYTNAYPLDAWRYITHMFVHGDLFHLAINMFCFYGFAKTMEGIMRSTQFLRLYFISGAFSIFVWILLSMGTDSPVVGASGAICGIFTAFAMKFPQSQIALLFIPMKAKTGLFIGIIASIVFIVFDLLPGIAHSAHLGGCLGGFIFMKYFFNPISRS